ncbi:MAG: hypothetical protein LBK67_05315 [Coriobacteriales bacterium]|jgi:hypothetical protein|nr:hypothetical protein [Coriobacteriales bacterium]
MVPSAYVEECTTRTEIDRYVFVVKSYFMKDGAPTASEKVRAILEEQAIRTLARKQKQT